MSLKNLTENLKNFKWTNYGNVGNNSAPPSNGGNLEPPEPITDQKKKLVYTGPPIPKSTREIKKTIPPIKDVNLSKTMSIIDRDIKNPMNLSQIKGRHGGTKDGGLPPHPEEHSLYDDGAGENLSQIKGRHGGFEGGGQPSHPEEHSLLDDGAGVSQPSNGLINLTQNLENFKWTDYDNVGDNLSQIGGHHGGTLPGGQPPHPEEHSLLDDGAGTPQSFYDGHSSVVTGQKTFERPNPKSLDQMESKFGPLNTQPLEKGPYGVADYMDGTKQGRGFIPPGGPPLGFTVDMGVSEYAIGDPLNYTLTPLSHTIASVNSGGPHGSVPEHTIDIQFGSSWSNPEAINAWAEDFMTTPLANYVSQYSEPVDSLTHQVDMITLTGPTVPDEDHYLNVTPKVDNAHGSDFMTLPISGYPGLYIGSQGDIVPIIPSVLGLGVSDSISATWPDKIFHQLGNLQDEKLYDVYQHHFLPTIENFNHISLLTDLFEDESISVAAEKWKDGSVHIGIEDWAAPVGGGVTSWANLMPITPRYSMFRDAQGNYQVPTLFPHEWTNQPTFNVLGGYPESTYGGGYTINSQFGFSWNDLAGWFMETIDDTGQGDATNYSSAHGAHSFEVGDINIDLYESMPKYHLDTPLAIKWHLTKENIEEWPYKQFGFTNSPEYTFNEGSLDMETSTGALVFATQPFIRRQAGQGYLDGRGTGVVGMDHLTTVIARVEEDTMRITSWLNTPAGKSWHGNQYTLQNLNPRPETRIYNPLSLITSLVPHFHGQRHLSGFFGIFPPAKYGDLQTDMDYQEEGPGWDGKDTAGIWGYGTREAGSFDIGEKNRLTGLTAQFIGGAKPEEWKHLWNTFPSWDGGFWSAISGMENWSATNRGRTPEKPTQVVFSQKGAYGQGLASTNFPGGNIQADVINPRENTPGDVRPHYSLSRYWADKGLPQSSMLTLTGHRVVNSSYLSLAYSHLDFELAGYSPSLNAPFSRWNSGILENNWRFWPGSEENSQKDLYWADKTPVDDDNKKNVKEHLEDRVFTLGKHSSISAVGLGTSWASDSGARKGAPRGPVSFFTTPYLGLTSDTGYAPQTGFEFVSRILGDNWIFFDPTNKKAFHWHKSLSTNSFHNSMDVTTGAKSALTQHADWEELEIQTTGIIAESARKRQEAARERTEALQTAQRNADTQAKAAEQKKEEDWKDAVADIHQKMSDLGGPFTIGKKSNFSLTDYVKSLGKEPTDIALQASAFDSLSQLYGVHGNPLYTTVDGAPKALPRTSPDFLTKSYNKLNGISVNPHWSDYSNEPEGEDVWNPLSQLINYSWKFWDPENSKLKGHIGEERLGELKKTKLKELKTNIFTLSDKVAKGLGSDGLPSENLLKRYSTLAYGHIPDSFDYEAKEGKKGAPGGSGTDIHDQLNYEKTLRSPSELNMVEVSAGDGKTKREDWLEALSSKDGRGATGKYAGIRDKAKKIVDDIGQPGQNNVSIVKDKTLGVIKKGLDSDKYKNDQTDLVNLTPYGSKKDGTKGQPDGATDFIKFKFRDITNNKFIIFRAILSGISDSITPEWTGTRYIGRPDQVYVYQGAERKVNFSLDIYPKTKQELPVLWEKINYLVGLCYPSYVSNRMIAPFIELTIGDMFVNTPGFLDSLSVEVNDLGTWEIENGLQLPKHITCQCSFTYVGKYIQAQKGKHYELGWLPDGLNSDTSVGRDDIDFKNWPDRANTGLGFNKISPLFKELGQ